MEIKLGIGLPHTSDLVHKQFFDSWVVMERPANGFMYLAPQFPSGSTTNIAEVRNKLAMEAIEAECTHLLMMDTDQTYPVETIPQLLSHDLDIVTAKVHRRYPPFDPILLRGTLDTFTVVKPEEWRKGGLVEVDATGTGCMLVKTDVFLEMNYPWFEIRHAENGKTYGEDIMFCVKARGELKRRIFVDTSIEVGHLGLLEVNADTFFLNAALEKGGK